MDGPRISTRLLAAVALVWGVLVWANWFPQNRVEPWRVGRALAAFGEIRPGPGLAAAAGHARLAAWAALLGLAAAGAGVPLVGWLAGGRRRGPVLAMIAGAGALGLAVLGAGLAGLLFPGPARLAVVLLAPVARPWRWRIPARWRGQSGVGWPAAALAAALGPALLGVLAPEVSFDALAHHLAHPETYRALHRVVGQPHHFLSHYPALLEMQYTLAGLLAGDPQAAKLVHFGWGLLGFVLVADWARERVGAPWALAGTAAFVLLPYVQTVLMWAYVDLGAAGFFTAAALAARAGAPALAGALAGCCAGTKATGIFAPVLCAAVLAARRPRRSAWLAFGAGAFLAAVPWGLKNWFVTGNPFAPFLSAWLPTLRWGPANQLRYHAELASYAGAGPGGVAGFLLQPWLATVRNFGVLDQQAGMSGWFLWLLPLLLLAGAPGARLPAWLAAGWWGLWWFIPRQVRYLLPAWPAAAVAAVLALRAVVARGGLARLAGGLAAGLLVYHLAWAYQREHYVINPERVAFGLETADDYRARGLPGKPWSIRMANWMHRERPAARVLVISSYGLNLEWGPRAVSQSVFDTPEIERLAREVPDAARLRVRFRQAGYDRVLYSAAGGFGMHAVYGMYGFDRGAAARWRAFWPAYAEQERNESDQFLLYRLRARPLPRARASALPGLDEQWLGAIDYALAQAEAQGTVAAELPGAEAAYLRVAEAEALPAAWERVGTTRLRRGRYGPAGEALRRAAALGRDTAVLHDAQGVVLAREGRPAEAEREFRRAVALMPDLDDARRNLVRTLWGLDRRPEALAAIREGLALSPTSGEMGALYLELTGSPP